MRIALIAALAFAPGAALAQGYVPKPPSPPPVPVAAPPVPQSSYDWQSGNAYRTQPRPDGSTTVYGNNYGQGTSWQTTIKPDGRQTGTDADGNMWTYNPQTGTYLNLGTGKMCTGKGAARVCN